MKNKIVSLLLILVMIMSALSLSSCGSIESKNPARPDDIPYPDTTTIYDLESDVYRTIAETNNVKFEFNDQTTDIRVTNKLTNFTWSTEYYDTAMDQYTRGEVLRLNYTTVDGSPKSRVTSEDSVALGQYRVSDIENGVKVQYGFGEIGTVIDFPVAISPKRLEEFKARAGELWDQYTFDEKYKLIDFEEIEADEEADEADIIEKKKAYPLALNEPWYYCNTLAKNIGSRTATTLHDFWYGMGYTEEDYAIDSKGVEVGEVENEEFNVEVEYTLVGDNLKIKIPESKIYCPKDCKIQSLELHPNLLDFDSTYSGYYLLPDGSGSLMNFNNGKQSLRSESVYIQMYGIDEARGIEEKMAYFNDAILPVYGCTVRGKNQYASDLAAKTKAENDGKDAPVIDYSKRNYYLDSEEAVIEDAESALTNDTNAANFNGFFATINSGETFAGLTATTSDSLSHNRLVLEFRINEVQRMKSFGYDEQEYLKYQFQRYLGDIEVEYHFSNGDAATYSGMAQYYKQQLFGDEKTAKKEYLSTVETLGLINGFGLFMGISYNKKIPLTTFDQVKELTDDLKANGFNNLNVKMTGWCNGGFEHGYLDKINVSKELGGEDALNKLIADLKADGVNLYPDVDYQNVYAVEKTPNLKDVSYSLNNSLNVISSLYNPITYKSNMYLARYALTSATMQKNLDNFMNSYSKYDVKNVSLRSVGSQITANYREEDFCERQETLENMLKQVSGVKDKGYSIMGTNGDAKFLKYLDIVNEMPITSSGHDKTDYSVPFTAMVLSGHVDYTANSINLSNNTRKDLLQMIEAGAGAYYTLTSDLYEDIQESSYVEYYSTTYSNIKNDVINSYSYLKGALKDVYGLSIVKHQILASGVNMVTYEDGTSIVVNYNNTDFVKGNITCKANDYSVIKEA